jgi:hypothetical protein
MFDTFKLNKLKAELSWLRMAVPSVECAEITFINERIETIESQIKEEERRLRGILRHALEMIALDKNLTKILQKIIQTNQE